ncbi:hypothetical protein MJM83_34765, partial [Salmonella enterica subsp. enterica serovar Montevideo]|nr:hypothetical protein [Salmonella enterica subsp. enterica serovar Montevideo]
TTQLVRNLPALLELALLQHLDLTPGTGYAITTITKYLLMLIGAALFWPAAEIMNYTLFLIGLFIIAAGLGCLETAANPFVTV